MANGTTAVRDRPYSRPRTQRNGSTTRPPVQPHHRRRRTALGILALAALIAGMIAGSGGGTSTLHVSHPTGGYFGRIATLGGEGKGSFIYAQQVAENKAINRTLAITPGVIVAGAQHREIALTFDDGPGPYTPEVVSVLERYGVPGTFFEVGSEVHDFHAGTADILAHGWPIGDHTETHPQMSHLSLAGQRQQLLDQIANTGRYGAPFPRLFRPPYGVWDATTLSLTRKYRMLMVLWTVDTEDYRLPGVDSIVQAVLSGARPGAIVLMHDGGGNRQETVDALPTIIKQLRARGYKFVTVPKLLLDNPPSSNQQLSSMGAGAG
jgi:peptidoglycan/xylan/chitin deacetylase (PgdA/CDA1 family)